MSRQRLKKNNMNHILLKQILIFSDLNSGDYIGQKLRENSFDPKGKGTSTMLDDLVKNFTQCILVTQSII